MGLLRVLAVRAAEADVGPDAMSAGRGSSRAASIARRDRLDVVAVLDPLGVPAVRVEARQDVLRPGHRRRAVELDVVVVVEDDQLAEPEVAGERRRLRRRCPPGGRRRSRCAYVQWSTIVWPGRLNSDARRRSAIAMPDRVREALAERPGRRFDARRQRRTRGAPASSIPTAGMTSGRRATRRSRSGGGASREASTGVAGRQHEPVAIRPVRVRRRVAEEAGPEHVGHRSGAHRGAGVTGVRLLDAVDRERPDGVDGQLVEGLRRQRS